MEIQYKSDVGEDKKKLSIPVTLAAVAGITNSTGNPIAFSPPFLSHRSSTLQTGITGRSGMTIRTRGHRLDAERSPDEEEQSASLQSSRDRGRSGLKLIHSYLYISQIQWPRSNHQYFYF
ncbi:hypothetical protein ACLB2K_067248 [Fragaria x ananassa]